MRAYLVLVLAAVMLTGCSSEAPEAAAGEGDGNSGIPPAAIPADPFVTPPVSGNATAAPMRDTGGVNGPSRFTCANGLTVLADHDLAWDVLRLTIGQKTFELHNILSDTATNTYRSDTGRSPGKSLMWSGDGDQAQLIEGPTKAKPDSAQQQSVLCRKAG